MKTYVLQMSVLASNNTIYTINISSNRIFIFTCVGNGNNIKKKTILKEKIQRMMCVGKQQHNCKCIKSFAGNATTNKKKIVM